jgi:site-specific recombinase XerD
MPPRRSVRACLNSNAKSDVTWKKLARAQASPHTLESYGVDLRQFLEYFTPPDSEPPPLAQFGVLEIREWLADLYSPAA